jgi:hypothetical protein
MSRRQATEVGARRRRTRAAGLRPLLAGAAVALAAGAAAAEPNPFGFGSGAPWIFQSGNGAIADDVGFDHFTRILQLGTTTLHLYATAGPSSSLEGEAVCSPAPAGGSGDEICGMDVQINVAGPAYLAGFRPAGPPAGTGIAFFPTTFSSSTKSLRLNSVRSTDPIPAGAFKIGELDVTVTGANGVVVTVSGNAMVLGRRQVAEIEPNIIAVPEPGAPWLLASALVGLAALAGLRRLRLG